MHIINNENKPPTIVNKYNSIYFEKDISDKSIKFLIFFYLFNTVLCIILKYQIKNP